MVLGPFENNLWGPWAEQSMKFSLTNQVGSFALLCCIIPPTGVSYLQLLYVSHWSTLYTYIQVPTAWPGFIVCCRCMYDVQSQTCNNWLRVKIKVGDRSHLTTSLGDLTDCPLKCIATCYVPAGTVTSRNFVESLRNMGTELTTSEALAFGMDLSYWPILYIYFWYIMQASLFPAKEAQFKFNQRQLVDWVSWSEPLLHTKSKKADRIT